MFLSQLEEDIFTVLPGNAASYNLTKNEWLAMRGLAEDRSIIIKPADKGSCVVVWDRADYLAEAGNHLSLIAVPLKKRNLEGKNLLGLLKPYGCLKHFFQRKVHALKNTNISLMVLESQSIYEKYIFYPKYIRGLTMFQVARLYQIVVRRLKRLQNF